MSWLTILWAICIAASGMMAAMHLHLWAHDRKHGFYLWVSLTCFGAVMTASAELALMKASSPSAADSALLWQNLAVALIIIGLTWGIYDWFGAGRRWLAAIITALWLAGLAVNFLLPGNLVFTELSALESKRTAWGETYAVPTGTVNRFKWLADSASVLFFIYVVDASVRLWKRGNKRRAGIVGGMITFFILSAGVHAPLVDTGVIKSPYLIGFFFLAIIIGLTHEMLRDVARAARIAAELREARGNLEHLGRVNLLGEISAALAHELNQPLSAILANAQAGSRFLESEDPDLREIAEILEDITKDDKRAREVIQRLRSMLEKGEFVRERLDCTQLIRESVVLVETELRMHGVSVELDLARQLPEVEADRLAIQQVLLNLLLNAAQAAAGADGERRITVRCEGRGDLVRVEVADTGPGMDLGNLSRVFDPFFTTKPEGLGMGLSICKTIIENHGGELVAENRDGGGAVFTFSLPGAETEGKI